MAQDDQAQPDMSLIARQLRQLITDVASLRDDMGVLTAIVMRQDGTLSAMVAEMRAMHKQSARVNARLRGLETEAHE